jgi:hypothetical protein
MIAKFKEAKIVAAEIPASCAARHHMNLPVALTQAEQDQVNRPAATDNCEKQGPYRRVRLNAGLGDVRPRLPSMTISRQPSASWLQPLIKPRPWTATGADIAPTY